VPRPLASLAAALLLAACSGEEQDRERSDGPAGESAGTAPAAPAPERSAARWDFLSSGEGAALVFPASGDTAVRLFCPAGQDRILVNVPAFRPIGSEERLTLGSGRTAEAFVADTRGDRLRGGVSGTGAVPGNLGALIGGPVEVSYGTQRSGPHPAPPRALARAFLAACGFPPPPPPVAPPAGSPPGRISACLIQDGERLALSPLRGIGTEPFWGAEIEGRCVTYSHPENQQGTRVWTRYTASSGGGGTWSGALDGRPFVLRARPQPGCSDGMSDRRYPLAVELTVGGEQRHGCAEPG
jgi:uncharacterized membrane protein